MVAGIHTTEGFVICKTGVLFTVTEIDLLSKQVPFDDLIKYIPVVPIEVGFARGVAHAASVQQEFVPTTGEPFVTAGAVMSTVAGEQTGDGFVITN